MKHETSNTHNTGETANIGNVLLAPVDVGILNQIVSVYVQQEMCDSPQFARMGKATMLMECQPNHEFIDS